MKYIVNVIFILFISCRESDSIKKPIFEELQEPSLENPIDNLKGYVYICNSIYATKYHNDITCEGLINCTHEIETVSIFQAEDNGMQLDVGSGRHRAFMDPKGRPAVPGG